VDIESKVVSELVDDNISIKFYVQNTLITCIADLTSIVIWMHHICEYVPRHSYDGRQDNNEEGVDDILRLITSL
jgi:hypothetical protein